MRTICLVKSGRLRLPSAILTWKSRHIKCNRERSRQHKTTKAKKAACRAKERDKHTLQTRRGAAETAASLPLVNLFFILFRLWNNERTEPIQFLRSKRGPSALTVPESLSPRQRFLPGVPCTATSTTAQFSGSSRAPAPA